MLFAFSIILSFSFTLGIFANPTSYSNDLIDAENIEPVENQDGFILSQNTGQVDSGCDSTYTQHVTCGGPWILDGYSTILNCVPKSVTNIGQRDRFRATLVIEEECCTTYDGNGGGYFSASGCVKSPSATNLEQWTNAQFNKWAESGDWY